MKDTLRFLTFGNAIHPCICLGFTLMICQVGWGQDSTQVIRLKSAYLHLEADVSIPAKEEGVIKEIRCKVGDEIKADDLLALIDDQAASLLAQKAEMELKIASAEAKSGSKIQLSQAELKVAEAKLVRGRASDRKFDNSFSDTELEQLELDVTTKKIQLEESRRLQETALKRELLSQNALDLANALVERHQIRSTVEGMVIEVLRDPGEWVKPGEPVFRVIGLKKLKVIGFVDSRFASKDLVGRTIVVKSSKEGQASIFQKGKLIFVSPEFDPVNKQVKVIATVSNPDKRLNPGEKVLVEILPAGQ